jgi:hypothetical protein
VLAAEGAVALKGFVNCIAAPLRIATDLAGASGAADAGESLDIRITGFVSDSIAGSLNVITFVGSSGASAADRNAFWIDQLLKPDAPSNSSLTETSSGRPTSSTFSWHCWPASPSGSAPPSSARANSFS